MVVIGIVIFYFCRHNSLKWYIYSHQVRQRSTGLSLDRQCAFWHQIIGWKNTGIFQALNTEHVIYSFGFLPKLLSHQYVVVFLRRNQSKSVFGLRIQEAWVLSLAWSQMHWKMRKSLPSLSEFLHLANVDSDTHHQIMFAKCLTVLDGRQYVIANCCNIFSALKILLFSRNYF